jgi:hypothetical protein
MDICWHQYLIRAATLQNGIPGDAQGSSGAGRLSRSAGQRPAHRRAGPRCAGKCASAMSTWCSVATRVMPLSRALTDQGLHGLGERTRRVQRRQRFVDQPQAGRGQHRTRQAHTLAFTARQAVHALEELVGQVEAVQRVVRSRYVAGIEERAQAGPQTPSRAGGRPARPSPPVGAAARAASGAPGRAGRAEPAVGARGRPRGRCHPAARGRGWVAARRPAVAAAWSCRRRLGRSPPTASPAATRRLRPCTAAPRRHAPPDGAR